MKTLFITGATENTGYCTACHFAKNGYNVAISSRSVERADEAAKVIASKYNVKAKGYGLNLLDTDDIARVFGEIKNDFGSLDVFVANSANLGVGYDIFHTTPEDFDDIVNVNYKGTFFCCQNAARIMRQQMSGSIVLIGSVQSTGGIHGRTVYGSSKGALQSLNKYLALELAEYNVRSNIIIAGAVHSKRWDVLSEEEKASRRSRYPLGKEAEEQDIANAVYYLATDLSSNITGIDLVIDAGLSTCILPYKKGTVK